MPNYMGEVSMDSDPKPEPERGDVENPHARFWRGLHGIVVQDRDRLTRELEEARKDVGVIEVRATAWQETAEERLVACTHLERENASQAQRIAELEGAAQRVVDRCEIQGGWKAMAALRKALTPAQDAAPENAPVPPSAPHPPYRCGPMCNEHRPAPSAPESEEEK